MVNETQPPEPPEDDYGLSLEAEDAFFEALAGRTPDAKTGDEKAQAIFGDLLRGAFLKSEQAEADADAKIQPDPAREQRLLEYLRKKGAFDPQP